MTRYLDVHGLPVVRYVAKERPETLGPVFLINGIDVEHVHPADYLHLPHDPCSFYWRDDYLSMLASVSRDLAPEDFKGPRFDLVVENHERNDGPLDAPAIVDLGAGGEKHTVMPAADKGFQRGSIERRTTTNLQVDPRAGCQHRDPAHPLS